MRSRIRNRMRMKVKRWINIQFPLKVMRIIKPCFTLHVSETALVLRGTGSNILSQCGSGSGSREPNKCGSIRIMILVRLCSHKIFNSYMKSRSRNICTNVGTTYRSRIPNADSDPDPGGKINANSDPQHCFNHSM